MYEHLEISLYKTCQRLVIKSYLVVLLSILNCFPTPLPPVYFIPPNITIAPISSFMQCKCGRFDKFDGTLFSPANLHAGLKYLRNTKHAK